MVSVNVIQVLMIILFSGQSDSIKIVENFAFSYPKEEIILLYICKVGYRPSYSLPLFQAQKLSSIYKNISSLFALDGEPFQKSLVKNLATRINSQIPLITDLCILCQLTLNSLAAYFAFFYKHNYCLSNAWVLGESLNELLQHPFKYYNINTESSKIYSLSSINNIEPLKSSKCYLSFFHNYNFENISLSKNIFIQILEDELKHINVLQLKLEHFDLK